jgi:hypothetical protein
MAMANVSKQIDLILEKLQSGKCIGYRFEVEADEISIHVLEGDTPGELGSQLFIHSSEEELVLGAEVDVSDEKFSQYYARFGVTPWKFVVPGDEIGLELLLIEIGCAFGVDLSDSIFGEGLE